MENIKFPHILKYNSSAGSGKTHQLALRYLHLLLVKQPDVRHNLTNLLAITFTNKSAQEMRKRIIDWMKRIILDLNINDKVDRKIIDEIRAVIKLNNNDIKIIDLSHSEIQDRIKKIFNKLLKSFSDFKVSTIDSFVTLILKASAYKLGLPPDLDVSLNIDPFIDTAVDNIFQNILSDEYVRNVFDLFIENYVFLKQDKVNWFPKDFIKSNIKDIWKQIKLIGKNLSLDEKKLKKYNDNKVKDELKLKKDIEIFFIELFKSIDDNKLNVNKTFLNNGKKFLNQNNIEIFKKSSLNELFHYLNKASDPFSDELLDKWESIRKRVKEYCINKAFFYYQHLVEIFRLFEKNLYLETRYNAKVIMVEELNNLLKDVLKMSKENPEFLPELYYYLSARYYHFLFDEFQDTNYLQWENLKILTDEGLSSGGSLFIVGDKKQAIYGWRGASSELIDKVEAGVNIDNVYNSSLDVNYRSCANIIWFNNMVFKSDNIIDNLVDKMDDFLDYNKEQVIKTYKESHQKSLLNDNKGYVFIKRLIRKDLLADDIWDVIKDEFMLIINDLRKRGYHDKDICILCRKNKEVNLVVNWLLEAKINVESNATVDIRNNIYVSEIIALLDFLNIPENNFAFMSFVSGEIFAKLFLGNDKITSWLHESLIEDKNVILYLKFKKDFPKFWEEYFLRIFTLIGYFPAYEFILMLLKKFKVFQNFIEYSPYFLHLLEVVKDLENSGENGVHNLLKLIQDKSKHVQKIDDVSELFLINTGGTTDAVRVMTVHKSKGLEYPVVIMPFANLGIKPKNMIFHETEKNLNILYIRKEDIVISNELEEIYNNANNQLIIEELNNLYVSFTRAKKELHILLPESKKVKNRVDALLFENSELKKYIDQDILVIGLSESMKVSLDDEDIYTELNYEKFGNDIKWPELIKTKVARPEEISKTRFYARQKGEVIHYILSLIDKYSVSDLDKFIYSGFDKFNLNKDEKYINEIKHLLLDNFKNDDFMQFFRVDDNDKIYNEKDIVTKEGFLRRVDRFILRDDIIEVLDYKTGEEHAEEHTLQIKEYMELLRSIYLDKNVKGYLCYLDEKIVKEVI